MHSASATDVVNAALRLVLGLDPAREHDTSQVKNWQETSLAS